MFCDLELYLAALNAVLQVKLAAEFCNAFFFSPRCFKARGFVAFCTAQCGLTVIIVRHVLVL